MRRRFVEGYQQAGPSLWLSKLLPDSIFGISGYLCMLIGQQVPTAFDKQLLNGELERWESLSRATDQTAQNAVPIREALELVKSPNWPWTSWGSSQGP